MLKKNYTRKNLIEKIYQKSGFSKNISSFILDDFFKYLEIELIKSKNVKLSSFGTFRVVNKKERIGRNPKTKIEAKISARKIIKFTPSEKFKKILNLR